MSNPGSVRLVELLLVEDNPGDIRLTQEAFREGGMTNTLHVVKDGVAAMAFLRREGKHRNAPRPDLILLDLNLPKKDGREVLQAIKADEDLMRIPVVVLTTSQAEEDVLKSYDLNANCYISKPVEFEKFLQVVQMIENFWLGIVTLPPDEQHGCPTDRRSADQRSSGRYAAYPEAAGRSSV